jgi:hypothetical protein
MPATSGAPGRRSASSPPPGLGPSLRWRRVFPGEERQLGVMRRWLATLLPECPARDDVLSVANELSSNAIQHTSSGRSGSFAMEVTWSGPVVRVAVADGGAPDGPRVINDPGAEHGRGLLLVDRLSARGGVCGGSRGRLVWAEVPWGDAGANRPGSGQDPYEVVIGDGEHGLADRFAEVPAWFGRATLRWWALTHGGLVSAPSAQELATLLGRLAGSPSPEPAAAGRADPEDSQTARACRGGQRPGFLVWPVPGLVPRAAAVTG